MAGTDYGRSRHRLPRREGARCAGRTGGVPQYVPADGVHTWHRIPAKVCQVASPCLPPDTEFPRKCSRCLFPPSTCHGIPAKVCQVASSCFLPATESLRKCSRCLFPPSTCHGIPAKAFQVSFPASHLSRFPRECVPGGRLRQVALSCRPPATASPPMFWR